MERVNNWLISLSIAYWSILNMEERWLKRHKGYARIVLLSRRVFGAAVYTVITILIIVAVIKLGWVVVVVPLR